MLLSPWQLGERQPPLSLLFDQQSMYSLYHPQTAQCWLYGPLYASQSNVPCLEVKI